MAAAYLFSHMSSDGGILGRSMIDLRYEMCITETQQSRLSVFSKGPP
jgi:hypothetical protein